MLLAVGCGEQPAPAPPDRLPADFVGIYSDDVFFRDADYRHETLARQHRAGVRLIRQPFAWNEFEARPERYDEFVGAAADAGIRVLPVVLGPEPGVEPAGQGMRPPRSPQAYARFAAALVERYGPGGSFWDDNPGKRRQPIRSWQIWNEPNIPSFWAPTPEPAAYSRLLHSASEAIRAADPDAEIVAAGLPDSRLGMPASRFLEAIDPDTYDTVALHPYAATPAQVVRKVRAVATGDKPVWVTEFGWGTGGRDGPLHVSREAQARYVSETFQRLAALDLRGAVYFQWRDPEPFPGRRPIWPYFAGLLEVDGRAKPALSAFERAAGRINR